MYIDRCTQVHGQEKWATDFFEDVTTTKSNLINSNSRVIQVCNLCFCKHCDFNDTVPTHASKVQDLKNMKQTSGDKTILYSYRNHRTWLVVTFLPSFFFSKVDSCDPTAVNSRKVQRRDVKKFGRDRARRILICFSWPAYRSNTKSSGEPLINLFWIHCKYRQKKSTFVPSVMFHFWILWPARKCMTIREVKEALVNTCLVSMEAHQSNTGLQMDLPMFITNTNHTDKWPTFLGYAVEYKSCFAHVHHDTNVH